MGIQLQRQLFTVDEYYKMAEVGILTPEDKVELINGEIIRMSPSNSEHANAIDILAKKLIIGIGDKAVVRVQNPVSIDKSSEPEPDIAIAVNRQEGYRQNHPQPKNIILVVEVSDSTLHFDREVKMLLYAEAGIPEYWIVNLQDEQVEVFRKPVKEQYSQKQILFKEDELVLEEFGWEIKIEKLFE